MGLARFWEWFDSVAAPQLAAREISFRKVLRLLDERSAIAPVTIVETGCTRVAGNWAGDGQSTVVFDRYLQEALPGSMGYTIDIDPSATAQCRQLVGPLIDIRTGDSVAVLRNIADELGKSNRSIDLLYLDSYDVDWRHTTPSAVHHLKELVSIVGALRADTLVVVDDSPSECRVASNVDGNGYSLLSVPEVGGKGKFVAEYASQVGAQLIFSHYQAAWVGIGN
jgi:hypothetical protein